MYHCSVLPADTYQAVSDGQVHPVPEVCSYLSCEGSELREGHLLCSVCHQVLLLLAALAECGFRFSEKGKLA